MHSLRHGSVPTVHPSAAPGGGRHRHATLGPGRPRHEPGAVTADRLDALILDDDPTGPGPGSVLAGSVLAGSVLAGSVLAGSVLAVPGFDRARRRPLVSVAVAAAVAVIVAGAWWLGRPPRQVPVELSIPLVATTIATPGAGVGAGDGGAAGVGGPDGEPRELIVHVTGAVVSPGIVHLAAGDRVVDAVDAAGGPTPDADLQGLNLAAPVDDGVQIRVPLPGEEVPALIVPAPTDGGAPDGADDPVAINRADAAELERLPGIGPALASAIVEWRDEHGPFATVEALLDVPGIGPAKLDALADQVQL